MNDARITHIGGPDLGDRVRAAMGRSGACVLWVTGDTDIRASIRWLPIGAPVDVSA